MAKFLLSLVVFIGYMLGGMFLVGYSSLSGVDCFNNGMAAAISTLFLMMICVSSVLLFFCILIGEKA